MKPILILVKQKLTSVNLLCRMSKNSKFFKNAKLSGKLVNEFSYKAKTLRLDNRPISFGNVCNLFVYKYSSCKCESF